MEKSKKLTPLSSESGDYFYFRRMKSGQTRAWFAPQNCLERQYYREYDSSYDEESIILDFIQDLFPEDEPSEVLALFGLDWKRGSDVILGLEEAAELVENLRDREEEVHDYKIMAVPHYYKGHYPMKFPEFLRDDHHDVMIFSLKEAIDYLDDYYHGKSSYKGFSPCQILGHGQISGDSLFIVR